MGWPILLRKSSMKLRYPVLLQRIWPLIFSAFALWGLSRVTLTLHTNYEFSRYGVPTYDWYTDVGQQNEYIHYAYTVGTVTYGGQESWDEENSGIYYRHNGDKLAVSYLAGKSWVTRKAWGMQERWHDSMRWTAIYFGLLMAGIWLSVLRPGKEIIGTQNQSISTQVGNHDPISG